MNDVIQTRIASLLTVGVGLWLLLSPLFLTIEGDALASTLVTGGILTLAGLVQTVWQNTVPSWVSGLTAIWMGVSAAIYGMTDALLWSTVIASVATFVLAIWDGIEVDRVAQRHHTHA